MVDRILFSADDGIDGQALWISDGTAPGTSLVTDIAAGINSPYVGGFTLFGGGRALFTADDGTSGAELWITDGGPGGTFLVKDIRPGADASSISNITALGNGLAVFQANDGTTGRELWTTDGTEAGTLRLADMVAGAGNSATTTFAVLGGGRALFAGSDGTNGTELWVTDGTIAGTSLLKDIRVGGTSSSPSSFTALGDGHILFRATGSTAQGQELWISDGTAEGTTLVKEIRPGSGSTLISDITDLGDGRALFSADDGAHGSELWITDGTTAGTVLVRDIDPTSSGSGVELITPLGDGRALFQADDGTNGLELWVTDGTEAGTALVLDLQPGDQTPYYPSVREIVSLGNGTAVFAGDDGIHGLELWVTDGTTGGTSLLRDFIPGSGDGSPGGFVANGDGTAYFVVDDPVVGVELWVTDGTLGGTHLVVDVNTQGNPYIGGDPSGIGSNAPGEAIFVADDGTGGIWVTDGTTAGTVRLLDGLTAGHAPGAFTLAPGVTLFGASTADHGMELWVTDGTAAGTSLLKDINLGAASSYPADFIALGDGTALFSAGDGDHGFELWITDGTADGTTLFKDLNPGLGNSYAYGLTALGNGLIVFTAEDAEHSSELWVTDGTVDGTVLLKDINPGTAYSSPFLFTPIAGNRALFVAQDADGLELWVTDGTLAGTTRVKDINPGAARSAPQGFAALGNGQTLFKADDGVHGYELWTTDGTEAGTTLVKDIQTGGGHGIGNNGAITSLGNGLAIFAANDGTSGTELWVTDGTGAGTSLLKDVRVGGYGSRPYEPVALGDGTALFVADDGVHGYELWRTDGTAGGTSLVKDIRSGAEDGIATAFGLTSLGDGRVIFTANDGSTGPELWISDGTEAGTVLLKDILSGVTESAEVRSLFLLPENIAADAPTGLDIAAILDTGASSTDNITSTASLTITGVAAPDVLVTLRNEATVVGQVRSDAVTGAWSITPAALPDGTHRFSATALNSSLNTSVSSAVLTVKVDNADPVVAITSGGGMVGVATQTISGTVADANLGSQVEIFDNGGGTAIATATIGIGGTWSVSVDLGDEGAHSLVAVTTDLAGNVGSSSAVVYTLNTSLPPPTVALGAGFDNGPDTDDGVTGITAPQLVGTASAGAVITVTDGGAVLGTTNADGAGAWSFALPVLAAGPHALAVSQTNGGITSAAATFDLTIDPRLHTGTAGRDVFTFTSAVDFTDPVRWIDGLAESDTLSLTFTADLTDASFANLHNLEKLTLGATGSQSLVLGTEASLGFGSLLRVTATAASLLDLDGSALGAGTALIVVSGSGDDSLIGGAGNDSLTGGVGNDTLIGGEGDDRLYGGLDTDSLVGGAGNDRYVVDFAGDAVVEAADAGIDRVSASISYTLGAALEHLTLTGSADLDGTGNALANRLTGNDGANALDGSVGNDSLTGGAGHDTLIGGEGNDRLDGGLEADSLVGGAGNDAYVVDAMGDVVVEDADAGIDRVSASISYVLHAALENLTLTGTADLNGTGNALANALTGNAGANGLDGGLDNDSLDGGAGNDTLIGGEGNDRLDGGLDADSLVGGEGNDVLDGGLDADVLVGDAGNDVFRFTRGEAQGDIVADFVGNAAAIGDRLRFSGYGTAAEGAQFVQIDATTWQITSSDNVIQETIQFTNAAVLHASDWAFV